MLNKDSTWNLLHRIHEEEDKNTTTHELPTNPLSSYNYGVKWVFAFIALLMLTGISYAQWSTDPRNNLIVGYGLNPEIASDSAGGCYITYEQNLSYPRHLILERLNRYGYKPWGGSRRITGLFPEQSDAKIVEDGNHGVIVAYTDFYYSGSSYGIRVRVQRVDSSGNFLW